MNQVTVHSNQNTPDTKKVTNQVKKMVSNSSLLDIEAIEPFYRQQAGTNDAVFISII